MSITNSALPQFSLPHQQLMPEAASKPAPAEVLPTPLGASYHSAAKSTGRDAAPIEYEMFIGEGDIQARNKRSLFGRAFKKKKTVVPNGNKAPEGSKTLDGSKASSAGASTPGTSRDSRYDADIAKEQAGVKLDEGYISKLGSEKIVILEPLNVKLEVPGVNVNGKAVAPYSPDSIRRAKEAFEEASGSGSKAATPDTPLDDVAKVDAAPVEKKKLSDFKKGTILVLTGAVVTPVVTAISKLIEKHLGDNPVTLFKTSLAETKIVDKIQEDVFSSANMLVKLTNVPEVKADFQWALKSTEERMTSLESIVIETEKGFGLLAKEYGVNVDFKQSRIEDPDIEVRAKVVENKLAVIAAVSHEIALKMEAEARKAVGVV